MSFRIGRVSELDAAGCRARVVFEGIDSLVSWWLPVMQPKTLADQVYWMPDVEEHVVCLMDEHSEFGVVMGAIYSAADSPPVASLDKLHIRMKDGSSIEYDREEHQLAVHVVGGDVTLQVDGGRHVFIGGEAGAELVTRSHLEGWAKTHTHISAAPGSPTSAAVIPPPAQPGVDLTTKQMSE